MNVYGVILFASFAIAPIVAQQDQSFNGTCLSLRAPTDFNETKFAGTWYEVKRYVNTLITGQCGLPDYLLAGEKGGYNVSYLTTNLADKKNDTNKIELKRQGVGTSTPGLYDVYVNNKKDNIPQYVLKSDYDNYGIVWGCTYNNANKTNIQRLSIYSRKNTLDNTLTEEVMKFLNGSKINTTVLQDVEQDNKKCGRSSATAIVLPTILSSIIAMLLAQKF